MPVSGGLFNYSRILEILEDAEEQGPFPPSIRAVPPNQATLFPPTRTWIKRLQGRRHTQEKSSSGSKLSRTKGKWSDYPTRQQSTLVLVLFTSLKSSLRSHAPIEIRQVPFLLFHLNKLTPMPYQLLYIAIT